MLSFCFAAFSFSQVLFFGAHNSCNVACGASAGTQVAHVCQASASGLPFWSFFLLEGSPCCEDCVMGLADQLESVQRLLPSLLDP